MNISFDWLKQYVELGAMTPKELDDLLTFSGLEVEGIEKVESIRGGLEHVVIAQVLTCEPHPDTANQPDNKPVFNRICTLKDSWAKIK